MFFRLNGSVLEKYEVVFDEIEIERLREEVFLNCSYIEHKEYETTRPERIDGLYVRNISKKRIGVQSYHGALDYMPDEDLYLVKYDNYIPPKLFDYLCEILRGEYKNLDKIFLTVEETAVDIDKEIHKKYKELNDIDIENIESKQEKLEEIKALLNEKRFNKNQVSTREYYVKARELISLKLVDTINLSEVYRIKEFFGTSQIKENILKYTAKL